MASEPKQDHIVNRDMHVFYNVYEGFPHLIFLHGTTVNHTVFRHQIDYFHEKGYGIIAVDQRGDGKSGKSDKPKEYTLDKFSEDLEEIMEKEEVEKATIIGHSAGAMVALNTAAKTPELVDSVVSIEGSYNFSKTLSNGFFRNLAKKWVGIPLMRLVNCYFYRSSGGADKAEDRTYIDFSQPQFAEADIEWCREIYTHMGQLNYGSAVALSMEVMKWDISAKLADVKCPVLLIHGKKSQAVGSLVGNKMSKRIQGPTDVIIIDDARHQVMLQKPEEVNTLINYFLLEHQIPSLEQNSSYF